jgi:hypothetical protein
VPLGREAGAAILDHEHLEAAVDRCADDALDGQVGRHAADQQGVAPQHAQHRIELGAVRAVHRHAAGEDEVAGIGRHRRVRFGPPRPLDQRRLRGGAPVEQCLGPREIGLAGVVHVADRHVGRVRGIDQRADLGQHAALLHLRGEDAAEALLADVRFVHDVVLQLDEEQGGTRQRQLELGHV